MLKQFPAQFASIIASTLLVASCASSPQANLYILEGQSGSVVADWSAQDFAIIVGPTGIPSYLKRDEIVTRDQRHQIETLEYEQWADQLGRNVSNVPDRHAQCDMGDRKPPDRRDILEVCELFHGCAVTRGG